MALTKEITAHDYTIEVGVERLLEILKKDSNGGYANALVNRLDEIDGVDRIEYDGHFGPYIFVRVEIDYDTPETWEAIEAEINA